MARYIDVDKLIAEYDRVHIGPAGGARKLMVEAPTADVVKVVRCKDCEFAKPQALKLNGKELRKCDLHKRPCFLTDFCNYGELKEGMNNA